MRKTILVVATLVCSGLWAFAQTSPSSSSGSTSSTPSSSSQMGSSASSSGSSQSFSGCLGGSAGNFTLKDKASGTTYNLSGDDSELAKHVGEEVSITGSANQSSAASSSGTASSSTSSPSGSSSGMSGGQSIRVASVSKVASSCSNQ